MTAATRTEQTSADELKVRLKQLLRERLGVKGAQFPLSPGQEALWFLWQLAPASSAFSMALPLRIRGALDHDALNRAFTTVVERHDCVHMQFSELGGTLRQQVDRTRLPAIERITARDWDDVRLIQAVRQHARAPFDLRENAQLRARLFEIDPAHHVLSLVLHHIVGDLWSLIVLMDELRESYEAATTGRMANLTELPLRFEDYVLQMRGKASDGAFDADLDWWAQQLGSDLPVLDLPCDYPRPPRQKFRGATHFQQIDATLTTRLEGFARAHDTTLFMALLASYQILLHRFTGQERIITGTPFSGRRGRGFGELVGDFINMLPVPAQFATETHFAAHLAATRSALLGAMQHQDCPFSMIADRVAPTRDLSHPPVFQTTFVLQEFHRYAALQNTLLPAVDEAAVPFADLLLEPIALPQQDGQFDLNLEMKRDSLGRLQAAWKYDADLFLPETIAGIASSFEVLLRQMLAAPDLPISDLSLLDADTAAAVIAASQGPQIDLPEEKSVVALFESWAVKTPDAPALCCGEEQLSYAEVHERAVALARGLAARGVGPEVMVSLALPRGPELALAMLGTMRAGGAFLPLSPELPPQRLGQVVRQSDSRVVVTTTALAASVRAALESAIEDISAELITIDTLVAEPNTAALPGECADHHLAYMMFTSGSTGTPKGVMVEHIGMVNHTLGKLGDLDFSQQDRLAQNAPQSFDVVVWQNLAPLACGGSVQIIADEQAEDPARLFAECIARGVTVLQVVPSMMRALIEEAESADNPPALGALRWLVPTGEALPTELCQRWLALYPDIPILNTYGSTECSDDQCHYRLTEVASADAAQPVITVGQPIRNMAAYVLDRTLSPVPPGVVGELYIGGIGVGRGYRDDSVKTAAAFLTDPFSAREGARVYKSRDMARRRPDGRIEFLGRLDSMVKLHGVRIEPAEIEATLMAHADVSEAIVQPRSDPDGQTRLVAYVVLHDGASLTSIRAHLSDRLPFTMIPDLFVPLASVPLTANGKLDLAALPAPEWPGAQAAAPRPPQTATQHKLASIWADLLQNDAVSIRDDFFACGGDSIKSIKLAARAQELGLDLEVVDVFVNRTIEAIAEQIELSTVTRGDKARLKHVSKQTALVQAAELLTPDVLAKARSMVHFDNEA
ncbi:MAG: amino acid adenylation domain-containing protein [Gammaproteobacteria bacterium]|nr:amino acid adenylation domain-containing protein [Gammaproteobacteria bacterium]